MVRFSSNGLIVVKVRHFFYRQGLAKATTFSTRLPRLLASLSESVCLPWTDAASAVPEPMESEIPDLKATSEYAGMKDR